MLYVDLIFIEDLVYNYVVLFGVSILLTRVTNVKKILLSSIIGTIPLIILFTNINNTIIFLISFVFSIIMSIVSFSYKNILYTIKNTFYMYMLGIFIAGFIYLINVNLLPEINNYLLNVIILISLSPIITLIYIKSISKLKIEYSNYYKIDIYFNNKDTITLTSFLDTGNKLIDPYKQRPIILIKKTLVDIKQHNKILVPYNTVNNNDLLKCIVAEKIYIHNIGYRKKFLIGLIDEVNIEGAECIMNPKLLERI